MAGNHFEGLRRTDRTRGGDDANPRLAGRRGLEGRRADAEAAAKAATAEPGKKVRAEPTPPAKAGESGSVARRAAFLKHLDRLLGNRR